jgi:hypothetical protein
MSQTITYTSNAATKTPSKGISSVEIDALVGAIAALVIIGVAVVVIRRRR